MKSSFRYAFLIVGILLGLFHLRLAAKALFVFRGDESLLLRLFVLFGPLSTLPASITAFFRPLIGATWLIVGSAVSFLFVVMDERQEGDFSTLMSILTTYSLPMFALGVALLFIYRMFRDRPDSKGASERE